MDDDSRDPVKAPTLAVLIDEVGYLYSHHGTSPGEPEHDVLWHLPYSFLLAHSGRWQKHFLGPSAHIHLDEIRPGMRLSSKQDEIFNHNSNPPPSQTLCSKVFDTGDVMFHCADCGRDESCVFCSDCFSPDQHKDHDITFAINQGAPVACVCPDSEAWKRPLDCPQHGFDKSEPKAELPDDLTQFLRTTIASMLDFICLALAASPAVMTPPSSPQIIPQLLSFSELQGHTTSKGPWSVILWNDEKHSYEQVITQLCRALPSVMTRQTALQSANRVDSIGREVVLTSHETTLLYTVARIISNIDLACTVASSQSTFFESAAGIMISILEDLARTSVLSPDGLQRLYRPIRYIIAEELLRKDPENRHSSRMVRLLQADVKLWKKARLSLRSLYSQLLVLGGDIRTTLASHFMIVYPKLFNRYLLTDREPEYNIIQITTQLFTVPNAAASLLKKHDAGSTLIALLYSFFTEQVNRRTKALQFPPQLTTGPANAESSMLKHKRYVWAFTDLNRLFKSPQGQQEAVASPDLSDHFINLALLFHGFNPMTRQTGRHVEYESEAWVNAFNISAVLGKTCRAMGQCFDYASDQFLLDRIINTFKILASTNGIRTHSVSFAGCTRDVIDFTVSRSPVSFHYPLNWHLAEILKRVARLEYIQPRSSEHTLADKLSFPQFVQIAFPSQQHLLAVIDPAVRVNSLIAQSKAGLWVRNGMGIRYQQMHYKESSLREITLDQEMFLLQVALCLVDPDAFFITLIDRFEVGAWLFDDEEQVSDFEPAQLITLVEELLALLTVLLGEPSNVAAWPQERRVRREVQQALALGPCSHSELLKRCSEVDSDAQMVHQALAEVSNYRPPIGTTDQGFYSLKKELFMEVDPFYYRYTRNQRDECARAIREATPEVEDEQSVVLPQRLDIGPPSFAGLVKAFESAVLVEFITQCLRRSLADTSNEISDAYLDLTVQLVVLALINRKQPFSCLAQSPSFYDQNTSLAKTLQKAHQVAIGPIKARMGWCLQQLGVESYRSKTEVEVLPKANAIEQEAKKAAAKARQAAIMAQFANAQKAFLDNIEDDEDDDQDLGEDTVMDDASNVPKSAGSCIVCQEELNASNPFGALALIQASNLIRVHNFESIPEPGRYPLGLQAEFPTKTRSGLHASSCGHMMHVSCFETYCQSVEVRQQGNPTRRHPEDLGRKEFICPLCKSLGNIVVPYPDAFDQASSDTLIDDPTNAFDDWARSIAADAEDDEVRSLLRQKDSHRLEAFAIRDKLPSPATEILQSVSQSQKHMLERIMQVSHALTMESHWDDPEGLNYYLPEELIAYTVSAIEVASRSEPTTAEPTLDSDQQTSKMLAVVKSLISILPELASITAGSPKGVDSSATAAFIGTLDPQLRGSEWSLVWREPLAVLIEGLALSPQSSSAICTTAFYSEMTRITKVITSLSNSTLTALYQHVVGPAHSISDLATFVVDLALRRGLIIPPVSASLVGKTAYALVMPFLRRACLVKKAIFSGTFDPHGEFDACIAALQIVPPQIVFKQPDSELVRWLDRWGSAYLQALESADLSPLSSVEITGTYRLVQLPWRLDELYSITRSAVCKRCDQTPSNAAICLLCGEMVCFQSFCCMDNAEAEAMHGECNTHMWRCGGSSGMYFLTGRCTVLYLHTNDAGAFASPPYLDAYGEVDLGHKRHRPQFLSSARYEELRMQWLNQSIPTIVARKLEASVDFGGWNTM